MQEIIKEYGPAMITVVAILAIAGLITFLFDGDGGGPIGREFTSLINQFFSLAKGATETVVETAEPLP